MATNLNYLIRVDTIGPLPAGEKSNLNTALIAFDYDGEGPSDDGEVYTFDDFDGVEGSSFDTDEQDILKGALSQDRVERIKAVKIDTASLQDVIDNDNDWFAIVINGESELEDWTTASDLEARDKILIVSEEHEDASGLKTFDSSDPDNQFYFAHNDETDGFYIAASATAKILAFDPDDDKRNGAGKISKAQKFRITTVRNALRSSMETTTYSACIVGLISLRKV